MLPKRTRLDPKIIRAGDRVRIVKPSMVVRVGYPKAPADYLPQAEERYGAMLRADKLPEKAIRKALGEIAYGLAKRDHFGGRERSVHLVEVPELLGVEFTVFSMRTVYTGIYFPPHSWRGWTDSGYDYEFEPGGLGDAKAHRLAEGWFMPERGNIRPLERGRHEEIPVTHLEKIDGSPRTTY